MDNSTNSANVSGKLYIVSTPIGNKDDISLRAINTIKRCDLIVCEEVKMGALTLKNLNLAKELIPLNENNESEMTMEVLNLLRSGKKIALISDAGTPVFADPGLYLVRSAISNNIEIEVVPGTSSIMTAIVRSGFDLYEFLYAGFLPRKNEDRDRKLLKLSRERRTVVIFETPYRLHTLLAACAEIMPDRKIYLGMNLTMPFETHHYGTFAEIVKKFENSKIKSEFVIVMEGNKEWIGKKKLDIETDYDDDDDDDDEPVEYEYPVKAHAKQIQERNAARNSGKRSFGDKPKGRGFGSRDGFKRDSNRDGGGFPKKRSGFSSDRNENGLWKKRNDDGGGFAKREGGFSNRRNDERGGFAKREGGFSKSRNESGEGYSKRPSSSSYEKKDNFRSADDFAGKRSFSDNKFKSGGRDRTKSFSKTKNDNRGSKGKFSGFKGRKDR